MRHIKSLFEGLIYMSARSLIVMIMLVGKKQRKKITPGEENFKTRARALHQF